MKKTLTVILSVLFIAVVVFFGVGGLYGFAENPKDFTQNEHVARIKSRYNSVINRYKYDDGSLVESFDVYPLYNQNEELVAFLVEMEPYGFEFVFIQEKTSLYKRYRNQSLYRKSSNNYGFSEESNKWEKYKVNKITGEIEYLLDQNGERVFYRKSPYNVNENGNGCKYLFKLKDDKYICAVKKDGKFFNLISGETFDVENNGLQNLENVQANLFIGYVPKSTFDL